MKQAEKPNGGDHVVRLEVEKDRWEEVEAVPGLYSVWSTFSDSLIGVNLGREDVAGMFVERAAEDAKRAVERKLDEVDAGNQFTMTFEEAVKRHRERT